MTVDLERAKAGDERAFASLVEPFRRELQLHCYRLLGSVQDAEDLVQETLLAAWRGLDGFEERASLRAWLYRIATNRSLNAIRERGRRPTTENTMRPSKTRRAVEPSWLEPYPDSALPDPAPVHRRAAAAACEAARSARAARRARLPHRRSRLDPRDDAAVGQGRAPTRTRNARLVHPRTRAGAAARLADRTGPSRHLQRRRRSRRHGAPPDSAELRRSCDHAAATVRAHRTRSDRRVPRRPRRGSRRPATATPDPRQRPAGLRLLPTLAAPGHDGAHPERQQGRRDHLLRRPRAARPLRSSRTHLATRMGST